jgi:micrococcal nuclease
MLLTMVLLLAVFMWRLGSGLLETAERTTVGDARATTASPTSSARPRRGPPAERDAFPDTSCIVQRVVDGDSFECERGVRVRLIGIDAPERSQGEPGDQATAALSRWLPKGRPVRLQFDRERADQYGRLLAYGWVRDSLVNEAMVVGGWVLAGDFPPNVRYSQRLRRGEDDARGRKAGLWGTGGFDCRPADRRRGRC